VIFIQAAGYIISYRGGFRRGEVDWMDSHLPFGEAKHKKVKKIVNFMAEYTLDKYIMIISTL